MVEFKRDSRNGRYVLMEINPKFWGSLDLAIAAGVDFPWLAAQMALGRLDADTTEYRVGVRYQWIFDELLHIAARPRDATAVLRDLRRAEDDVWMCDPLPAVFDTVKTAATIITLAARRELRHPHGIPEPQHR